MKILCFTCLNYNNLQCIDTNKNLGSVEEWLAACLQPELRSRIFQMRIRIRHCRKMQLQSNPSIKKNSGPFGSGSYVLIMYDKFALNVSRREVKLQF